MAANTLISETKLISCGAKWCTLWTKIILPGKHSVLIVSPVFHFERFIYAPKRKRKIETQSYVQYIYLNFIKFKNTRFQPGKQTEYLSNKTIFKN